MTNQNIVESYNYAEFVPEKFEPWMRFPESPVLGTTGPDFPLWHLDGSQTRLSEIWRQHPITVVEFGSFT